RFGLGTTEFGVLEVLYHKGELAVCDVQRRILVESMRRAAAHPGRVVEHYVRRGQARDSGPGAPPAFLPRPPGGPRRPDRGWSARHRADLSIARGRDAARRGRAAGAPAGPGRAPAPRPRPGSGRI